MNAQCKETDISIDDRTIKRVDYTKFLGLTIDAQLSWSKHVDEISKKVSPAIGALKRVRPFIPTDVAVQIDNALILPHFNYCSPAKQRNTAKHGKTRRNTAKHGETRRNTAKHGKTRRNTAKHGETRRNTAKHGETR